MKICIFEAISSIFCQFFFYSKLFARQLWHLVYRSLGVTLVRFLQIVMKWIIMCFMDNFCCFSWKSRFFSNNLFGHSASGYIRVTKVALRQVVKFVTKCAFLYFWANIWHLAPLCHLVIKRYYNRAILCQILQWSCISHKVGCLKIAFCTIWMKSRITLIYALKQHGHLLLINLLTQLPSSNVSVKLSSWY